MISVSFIIPVYNCKAYLEGCIRSILQTGLASSEIILVDDGSTDGSGAVCDALAAECAQIRVIHQSNGGASAARNRGLREARGERILFLDADDSIDSNLLAAVLADARCSQTDLTVYGMTFDYYHRGKCYRRDPLGYSEDTVLTPTAWGCIFGELFEDNALSPLWNKVFKREILIKNDLVLNEQMFLYEDLEFVLRYMCCCGDIWNAPQKIYHYRQAEDEGNAGRRLARIASIPAFLEPIENALQALCECNSALCREQADSVLQRLYLVLAREKIAVSDLKGIRRICREFSAWAEVRQLPLPVSAFQTRLMRGQAVLLWLANQKTQLRHRVAVWVKSRIC